MFVPMWIIIIVCAIAIIGLIGTIIGLIKLANWLSNPFDM